MSRAWITGVTLLLAVSVPAEARYLEYEASRLGWSIPGSMPTVRLAAMGGLRYAVEDEGTELNLSDFGRNLAGVARDRTSWTIDSWSGQSRNWQDENTVYRGAAVRQRARFDEQTGGVEVVYRQGGRRAIGLTAAWQGFSSEMRFGADARVRGPLYRVFVNETFGPLATAIGIEQASDAEALVSPNAFAVEHSSDRSVLSIAAAYDLPRGGMSLGAAVDFGRSRIEGVSTDPSGFHRDLYHWRRPYTEYRISLVRPEGLSALAFGAICRVVQREGAEEGAINWSDRFPLNPGRSNYVALVPLFTEEQDILEVEGRAAWTAARWLRVSGLAGVATDESVVEESADGNFTGSRRGAELNASSWFGGLGLGVTTPSRRVRVGVEADVEGVTVEEVLARSRSEIDGRRYQLRAGLEYQMPNRLILRGGYQRGSVDRDVDQAGSLLLANGGTLGFGYVPGGGTVSLDGAVRVWREEPENGQTAANAVAESGDVLFGLRVLF